MLYAQPDQNLQRMQVLHTPVVVHMRQELVPFAADAFRSVSQAGIRLGPGEHVVHFNVRTNATWNELITDGQTLVRCSVALETRLPDDTQWKQHAASRRSAYLPTANRSEVDIGGCYPFGCFDPTTLLRLVVWRETTQCHVLLNPSGTSILVV